ncbi:general stress protein [Priestia megaterium]|uniref:general stress protein n=1 Tax=Priestia megaterium TaxID=1404 RepID=UPI003457CCF6
MIKNVIGAYENEEAVITAIQNLKTQGFQEKDLSLVTSKDIDEDDYLEVESKEGIDVKKVETMTQSHQDESIMDQIKHVFSPEQHGGAHRDKEKVERRLISLGVPVNQAEPYADDLQKGKVLLLVRTNSDKKANSFVEKRGDSPLEKDNSIYEKSLYGENRNELKEGKLPIGTERGKGY